MVDAENDRIEKFNAKGEYKTQFGGEGPEDGQFREPWGIQINSHGEIFVSDPGNSRIQKLTQGGSEVHNTKTIYYTAKTEATIAACQNHPEWTGLPCQTEPAEQPADGLSLPVTTLTYNMWNKGRSNCRVFGSTTRTKKQPLTMPGAPLKAKRPPASTNPYLRSLTHTTKKKATSKTQSTTAAGKTRTITRKFNTLMQPIEYTDGDGSTTKYVYEEGSDDRLDEVSVTGPEGEAEREKGRASTTQQPAQ